MRAFRGSFIAFFSCQRKAEVAPFLLFRNVIMAAKAAAQNDRDAFLSEKFTSFLYSVCYTMALRYVYELLYAGGTMKSDVQLNIRAKEAQRALIDTAAEILHKSRTDFILEMACQAAENVILDRRMFNLNDEQYAEFIDMLDAPVTANPAMEKLLARKPQWDK